MTLQQTFTTKFKKDLKLMIKRGEKPNKIKKVTDLLAQNQNLPKKFKDHPLTGNFANRRDCHIEPDWILIYKKDEENKRIIFERTGTHSDLFKK